MIIIIRQCFLASKCFSRKEKGRKTSSPSNLSQCRTISYVGSWLLMLFCSPALNLLFACFCPHISCNIPVFKEQFLNFLCPCVNEKEAIFTCSESKLSPPDLQTQPNDSEELVRSPGEVSHCSSPHSPGRRRFSLRLAKPTFGYFFTWQCCCQLWRQKRRAMMRREAKTRRCRSEIRTITHEILSNFVFLLLGLCFYLYLCLCWSSPSLIWLFRAM